MSENGSLLRAARRTLLGGVAISAIFIGGILAVPKETGFAATQRLYLTVALFLIVPLSLVGLTLLSRRYRDAALLHSYDGATSAMRDTLNFILSERRLAARWRILLTTTAWSGLAGSVLCRWPQLQPIAPFGTTLHLTGGMAFAALLLQPLYVRANIVNGRYLKRYLKQQARHIGFMSARKRLAAVTSGLASPRESQFEAGGLTWELDDFYKNVLVLGMPGSGKTMTVLNVLTESLLAAKANGLRTAGVVFDPKGSLFDPRNGKDLITPLCERLGRADDLMIFSPDTWESDAGTSRSIVFNRLDTDADPVEVASSTIVAQRLAGGVNNQESFFSDSSRIHIRHSFALWRAALAPEPVSFTDIHRLCTEDPDDPEVYPWLVNGLATLYAESTVPADVENACAYFENEWRRMPDRQRAGVIGTVTQLIDDFSSTPIDAMTSGRSTMRIGEMIDSEKILYVHLPLAERQRLSALLSSMIKLEYQREVLRRVNKDRPSFMIADEFQTIWVGGEGRGDSDFFERSRESRHANVVAVQNLSSFQKKTRNKAEITNFIGLCAVKIFLRNSELETNRFASDLFGERSEVIVSMSESAKGAGGLVRNQTSYSRSTRSARVVPPEQFTRLGIPQKDNPRQQSAESVVHLGSRDTTAPLGLNWPVHVLKP